MRKRELKNMEWGIVIAAIILCIFGMIALFSATQETKYEEFQKQIIWFVISIITMIIVMFIDYETLIKISPITYRSFYNIINRSIIYKKNKWSNKLV